MRKTLSVFLIILILVVVFSVPALAENAEIDLSDMSLKDLLALHTKLDEVIDDQLQCRLDKNSIYQGVYLVGEDIQPGYYLFTSIDDCRGDSDFDFFYEIYESQDTYSKHNRVMFDRFNIGESVQINLKDGMVLRIINGTANVQVSEKPTWAP